MRRESRAGGVWCELTHDRFVQPILDANRAWAERNRNPLTVVTRIWLENNHDPQRLLRGKQLGDAQAYALTHSNWIGQDEKEFLEASVRHEREEKRRQQRAIAITTLVVMLLTGLGYWGWRSAAEATNQRTNALAAQNYAETQFTRARASELAAQSQSVLDSFPQRSLLLAVEAFSATWQSGVHVSAAEEALRQALGVLNTPPLGNHHGRINAMASSPDNHWLVTASDDNTARLWNLQAPNPAANPIILRGHTGAINAVAISSDNRWLVTASDDTTARLWNLQAPDPAASPIILRGHKYGITSIAISSDNRWLVTTSGHEGVEQNDATARLWNLQAPDPAANAIVLSGHGRAIIAVAISPDSHWLVTASDDATARLWNLRSPNPAANPIILRGHHSPVSEIAISSDSRWLVTASGYSLSIFDDYNLEPDSTARLWDLKASDPADNPIVLREQTAQISQVVISPDNRWLVVVSDKTYLWDLQVSDIATDPIILHGHEWRVSTIDISPDSHWLVTTSRYGIANQVDTTARLWNLWTPDPTVDSIVLRGHKEPITTFAISPDSHWLATGSEDATTHLWNLHASDPAANAIVLSGHEYAVSIVQFTANSRWLATIGNSRGTGVDASIRLWDLSNENIIASSTILRGHGDAISEIAISPDNHWLVTRGEYHGSNQIDSTPRLWNLRASNPAANPIILRGHGSTISAAVISPDSHWLVTTSIDATARLWDLRAPNPAANPIILRGHGDGIEATAISPDSQWLVTTGSHTTRLWNLRTPDPTTNVIVLRAHEVPASQIAISADSHWLVTAANRYSVVTTNENVRELFDSTARLWDLRGLNSSTNAIILRGHQSPIHKIAISPDNRWLVTVGGHGGGERVDLTVRLWDLQTSNPDVKAIVLHGHRDVINVVTISSDSNWLVTGSADATARLWDLRSANPAAKVIVLHGHRNAINAIAISPDNHWLVTGSKDATARLWDLRSANPAANPIVLRGHEGPVDAVAISLDNQWLVTASGSNYAEQVDPTVRLWSLRIPNPVANPVILRGHEGPINAIAISPDSHWLVTASDDTTARLWNLRTTELVDEACKATARNLSQSEWAQYFPNEPYRRTCPEFPIHFSVIVEQLERSNDLARSGNITDALNLYQQVLTLEPTLQFTPTIKVASALVDYAADLARSGEITLAVSTYDQALSLDPSLSITPELDLDFAQNR